MKVFDGTKLKELVVALSQIDGFVNHNNIPMMNGKRISECSEEELYEMGHYLIEWSKAMRLNRMFPIVDRPAIGEV